MQVENEYGMIQAAYGDAGARYAKWAGDMALGLNTSVPWIMCKQWDAPGSVVTAQNPIMLLLKYSVSLDNHSS